MSLTVPAWMEKTLVVFETLYYKDLKVVSHTDLNDQNQAVSFKDTPDIPQTGIPSNIGFLEAQVSP